MLPSRWPVRIPRSWKKRDGRYDGARGRRSDFGARAQYERATDSRCLEPGILQSRGGCGGRGQAAIGQLVLRHIRAVIRVIMGKAPAWLRVRGYLYKDGDTWEIKGALRRSASGSILVGIDGE